MEIGACEQLPICHMRRALDGIWAVGLVRSRVILHRLDLIVRQGRALLTFPESPAHVAQLPPAMVLALSMWMWMNLRREAYVTLNSDSILQQMLLAFGVGGKK
jgi:hypothetical protein